MRAWIERNRVLAYTFHKIWGLSMLPLMIRAALKQMPIGISLIGVKAAKRPATNIRDVGNGPQ